MVGKPEGADFGGKKEYEALIDDSIAGTRIKQVTKSRHRIRCTVILFVFILYVSLVLSSWRGSKKKGWKYTNIASNPSAIIGCENFLFYEMEKIIPTFQGCSND